MSIIEIPIYETFPQYHSICNKKLKDISKCKESWSACPTSTIKEIHSFLLKEYATNEYLYTFIDSLTHIKETNIQKWKAFIYTSLQEEEERLTSYIEKKNESIDIKHILSFLEGCGFIFSKQHKGNLSTLFETILAECTQDCLPYLCLCITSKQEILSSCILYRYSFKQLIECSHICGNPDILFSYMLNQPEYSQLTMHYTMTYSDSQTNHSILTLFSTVISYGFQLRKASPYQFYFIRSPHILYAIDKEAIMNVCQTSFKMVQSSFTVGYDSFLTYESNQQLTTFFSTIFYLLFRGNKVEKEKQLWLTCVLHKFKSSNGVCTYFDLFLFLLHHPTYCSFFLYNVTTLFILPPCIQDVQHIEHLFKKKANECANVNISCIGDVRPFLQYCIKIGLFSANCSGVQTNSLGYPSITLHLVKKLEYINIDAVLHSYLTEQTLEECTERISFFPHQLETIYKQSSLQFLQLRSFPNTSELVALYTNVDNPSPIIYAYSEHCLPSVKDIKECMELLTYSHAKIMCVVLVTPSFYFFIQLRSSIPSETVIHRYSTLLDKYNISLEGKKKCQQSVHKSFTDEWNSIEPFVIHSFIRDDAKTMWKISIPFIHCDALLSEKETPEEIEYSSTFSDIGPFYQLDDPKMHKHNEYAYIYDDENIEDINEQIAETEYSNALLFEQFNRYGIPEEEYEPERKQDTNKKEYYDSLQEKESYQLFLNTQYVEEVLDLPEIEEKDSDFSDLKRQNKEEKGQSLTSTIKELVPPDEELGSSEDYLLHINTVKEDMTKDDDHTQDSIYLYQMSLHL